MAEGGRTERVMRLHYMVMFAALVAATGGGGVPEGAAAETVRSGARSVDAILPAPQAVRDRGGRRALETAAGTTTIALPAGEPGKAPALAAARRSSRR